MYFDGGSKESFFRILIDRWKNLRDRFALSKYSKSAVFPITVYGTTSPYNAYLTVLDDETVEWQLNTCPEI